MYFYKVKYMYVKFLKDDRSLAMMDGDPQQKSTE